MMRAGRLTAVLRIERLVARVETQDVYGRPFERVLPSEYGAPPQWPAIWRHPLGTEPHPDDPRPHTSPWPGGAPEQRATWQLHAILRGEVLERVRERAIDGSGLTGKERIVVRTRHFAGLGLEDRMVLEGRAWVLAEVADLGRREGLKLTGTAVGADG